MDISCARYDIAADYDDMHYDIDSAITHEQMVAGDIFLKGCFSC